MKRHRRTPQPAAVASRKAHGELRTALESIGTTNPLEAALLLALPTDAAPGIDLYFDDQVVGFRGVTVSRTGDHVADSLALRAAFEQARYASDRVEPLSYRDLNASPDTWVGWYLSGTHYYSAGLWPLFGISELAVPARGLDAAGVTLAAIAQAVVDNPPFPLASNAQVATLTPTGEEVAVALTLPKNPAAGFTQVSFGVEVLGAGDPTRAADSSGDVTAWDVIDSAAAFAAESLGAVSSILVPLNAESDAVTADLILFLEQDREVVVPISASFGAQRSLQIGVPPSRILRSESTQPSNPLPAGFQVLGADRTEPGIVARHIESGVFCLFPG